MKINNIPNELKKNALWCLWSEDKIPYNPLTGAKAQANYPDSFSDFLTAYEVYIKGGFDGLGIGIYGGIGAIDIDNCIENSVINDMATDIIARTGSYTETSPSGKGIRIIFNLKNDFVYDKNLYYINNQKKGLEIYVPGATHRYVTITGNILNNNPVVDITLKLPDILNTYMLRERNVVNPVMPVAQSVPAVYPAEHYLKIGLEKDEKLKAYWNGARCLASESENDAGFMSKLLYWCNNDVDEAIKAFLLSPYASQKDYSHKKKINRPDYLPRVAKFAKSDRTAAMSDERWHKRVNSV